MFVPGQPSVGVVGEPFLGGQLFTFRADVDGTADLVVVGSRSDQLRAINRSAQDEALSDHCGLPPQAFAGLRPYCIGTTAAGVALGETRMRIVSTTVSQR
jgi:hypothetical protein